MEEPTIEVLAETEDYSVWRAEEPDGETTYHLELGSVTLHFFVEEWEEFLPGVDYRCTCEGRPAGEGAPPDAPGCAG